MTIKEAAVKTLSDNKALLTTAAVFEGGRIANKQVVKIAQEHLPAPMNLLAGTPAGQLVLANLVKLAAEQFRPGDPLIERLVNGMVVAAYTDLIQEFDLEGMFENLLNNASVKRALSKVAKADEQQSQ